MKVLVVGDTMTDVYYHGSIVRLNPEHPAAPLVSMDKVSSCPGGAANVSLNLERMGCEVKAIYGIGTILKSRIVTEDGVVCRFDHDEELAPPSVECVREGAEGCEAVIVSDYGKGTITREIRGTLHKLGIPIFVDTKLSPWSWETLILGAKEYWFFPNDREYKKYKRDFSRVRMVHKVGSQGAIVWENGLEIMRAPSRAVRVVNATGAGDTVIAAFVVGLLSLRKYFDPVPATAGALGLAMSFAAEAIARQDTYAPTFNDVACGVGFGSEAESKVMEHMRK